ncbi:sterol desaturase family protein [Caulobacter sp. KR2-114]|uniref:sterol desaturase family protein n=1 Tax=Caulobacter sp. KR2-114 TaxID=3400912 RepID=UPI003BFB280D
MLTLALDIALFLAAFVFMEGFAWFTHKYVMHGFGWVWHKSHHEPRTGVFELNDLFAVVFAAPAIACIYLGVHGLPLLLPIGLGITAYGAVYFMFHDGLVHRRYPVPMNGRSKFWKRLIQAHRIHHAVGTKHGCVSFGFLIAQPVRDLKAQLAELEAQGQGGELRSSSTGPAAG